MLPNNKVARSNNEVLEWRNFFKNDLADDSAFIYIENLRSKIEALELWKEAKIQAQKELADIPVSIIDILIDRFAPFIKQLPTGHGVGHLSRDLINLSLILQDPYIQQQSEVEIFVAMIAGIFHDIGNSIIERYDEAKRFTGHAEVGAYLFGQIAGDIIPPHLLKLIQFAISSHTNYLKDLTITKDANTSQERTRIRRQYDSMLHKDKNETHKIAVWITQASDKTDALGVPFITRLILTKAVPTQDYTNGEFHIPAETAEADFMHQFMPLVRTAEYKKQLITPKDKTSIILEHFYTFYETTVNVSPYSQYDTPYYSTRIATEKALDTARFIIAATAKAETYTTSKKEKQFENFYKLCTILEPALNTEATLKLLRHKFTWLSESYQNHWAYGFMLLTDTLYPRWYQETNTALKKTLIIKDKKLNAIVSSMHKKAQKVIPAFSPEQMDNKDHANCFEMLINA